MLRGLGGSWDQNTEGAPEILGQEHGVATLPVCRKIQVSASRLKEKKEQTNKQNENYSKTIFFVFFLLFHGQEARKLHSSRQGRNTEEQKTY